MTRKGQGGSFQSKEPRAGEPGAGLKAVLLRNKVYIKPLTEQGSEDMDSCPGSASNFMGDLTPRS